MFGHGSPVTATGGGRLTSAVLLAIIVGLQTPDVAAPQERTGPAGLAATPVETQLHIAWGGGAARQWSGTIQVSQGSINQLAPLGLAPDSARQIILRDGRVRITATTASQYNGFEAQVATTTAATLELQFTPDGRPNAARTIRVPVADLLDDDVFSEAIDQQQNQVYVRRASGDRLRVAFDRDRLIFAPGERWPLSVAAAHVADLPANTLFRFEMAIVRKDTNETIWSDRKTQKSKPGGTLTPVEVQPDMPQQEGVYDFSVRLVRVRSLMVNTKPRLQRTVQFVVLENISPQPEAVPERVVTEFDPASPSWLTPRLPRNIPLPRTVPLPRNLPLPQWTLPANWRQGPLGNDKSQRVQRHGQTWTQLKVDGWQAYPLAIDRVGQVHEVDLTYPADVRQTLLVSILEANADGELVPVGIDTGLDVPKPLLSLQETTQHHRVLFWPRTKTPLLLVANKSRVHPAVFGSVSVNTRTLAPAQAGTGQRMMLAMLDRPLFAENFSAPEAVDVNGRRRIHFDDWQTFYQGGRRLVDYLRHIGYSGVSLCVSSGGSTIYPSRLLQPTPRHDRGIYSINGQDPVRKDVLEMLFRLFDRDDLTLIPQLRFATPLPELEDQLADTNNAQMEGIHLVNRHGQTWLQAQGTQRGLAPYYNPLDPRVQSAMRRVVLELVDRYGHHRSFGGITLSMTPDGFTHFPDADWGMDNKTLQRFLRETEINLPQGVIAGDVAQQILARHRKAWLDWRAEKVSEFYRSLAATIATGHPSARLILAATELNESIPVQRSLRPRLPAQANYQRAMLELGLDHSLGSEPNIVMPRPHFYAPVDSVAAGAVQAEVNHGLQIDRFYQTHPVPSSIFYHQPQQVPLPSFDEVSPFTGRATVLLAHLSPSAETNRQRLIHAIAAQDVHVTLDGGWMIPLGQESSVRDVIATFQQLPAQKFETVEFQPDKSLGAPVLVRTWTNRDQTYLYVLNDAPWPVDTTLQLALPAQCRLQTLTSRAVNPVRYEEGKHFWDVRLQPYDLVAIRFSKPGVQVENIKPSPNDQIRLALQRLLDDVSDRIVALNRQPVLPQLPNGDFEAEGDGIPHWSAQRSAGTTVAVDRQRPHSGERCLRLASPNGTVAAVSEGFTAPAAGRFWVSSYLRASGLGARSRVRIVIDWDVNGRHFSRPFPLKPESLSDQFERFLLPLYDLPTDAENTQIRFELSGAGTVWIDDVVLQLFRKPQERNELTKIRAYAFRQLEQNRLDECYRQLSSFWPQFLLSYVPPLGPQMAELPQQPEAPPEKTNRSMLDRIWRPKLRMRR